MRYQGVFLLGKTEATKTGYQVISLLNASDNFKLSENFFRWNKFFPLCLFVSLVVGLFVIKTNWRWLFISNENSNWVAIDMICEGRNRKILWQLNMLVNDENRFSFVTKHFNLISSDVCCNEHWIYVRANLKEGEKNMRQVVQHDRVNAWKLLFDY